MEWRADKRLPREWLLSQQVPREVVWPALRENFAPVMQHGLRRYGVPRLRQMLAQGSLLVDLGYLDPEVLLDASTAADASAQRGGEVDVRLHEVVALERGLRTLLN
jgi:asparagine synthase (glutamine-hydrolysing)